MKLLQIDALSASYGDLPALQGVSLTVGPGEAIAIIGANGAGKSTLLKCIAGLMPATAGVIRLAGDALEGLDAVRLARLGVALVPEGRRLLPSLSVEENLLVGKFGGRKGYWTLERIYQLFPLLRERARQRSTSLSGGQQQMVAIGRALMSNPRVLLCDELSLGLAPAAVKDLYRQLPAITRQGTAILLVEQDIAQAMAATCYVYCLLEGRVLLEGQPRQLSREQIRAAYFGV